MLDVAIKSLLLKHRDGFRTVLKDISFSMPQNNIFTIVGKNGSGKSTGLLTKDFILLMDRFLLTRKMFFH